MTNTVYVTELLKACCIREQIIHTCRGARSNVQPLRDRLEELVVRIREDQGPQMFGGLDRSERCQSRQYGEVCG
jgi:hypothetical protein